MLRSNKMDSIKKHIIALDNILVGTLSKKYGQCGKKNCRCTKNKKYWHGPYYIWTRKEGGKTITKSLSIKQAEYCKRAIKNMNKLKKCIEKWKISSLNEMVNIG